MNERHLDDQAERPGISVVVCAYTERRWDALVNAIASIDRQTRAPLETIVVIDHNSALRDRAATAFPECRVVKSAESNGLSGARNTGVGEARGEIVAFLDDDACAEPTWLSSLVQPFADRSVIGCGGVALPDWELARPRWIPPEFLWVVGCSYRGLPTVRQPIRNPIGANMAFRRSVLAQAGGFVTGIGRVGRTPLGCEETELSIRARAVTGGTILHLPDCRVWHQVPSDRTTWRYFRTRCWAEGLSKALVRRSVGSDAALASERAYVRRSLPSALRRELGTALRGDPAGLARTVAIVSGLAMTGAGYLWGLLRDMQLQHQ
jgi:GT2 family glycosyltransferase